MSALEKLMLWKALLQLTCLIFIFIKISHSQAEEPRMCTTQYSAEYGRNYTCFCDQDCEVNKDCCKTRDRSRGLDHLLFECTDVSPRKAYKSSYYRVIRCCPERWPKGEVKTKCESKTMDRRLPPVYDNMTNYTYKNLFCAVCNNVTISIPWTYKMECLNSLNMSHITQQNINGKCILREFLPPSSPPETITESQSNDGSFSLLLYTNVDELILNSMDKIDISVSLNCNTGVGLTKEACQNVNCIDEFTLKGDLCGQGAEEISTSAATIESIAATPTALAQTIDAIATAMTDQVGATTAMSDSYPATTIHPSMTNKATASTVHPPMTYPAITNIATTSKIHPAITNIATTSKIHPNIAMTSPPTTYPAITNIATTSKIHSNIATTSPPTTYPAITNIATTPKIHPSMTYPAITNIGTTYKIHPSMTYPVRTSTIPGATSSSNTSSKDENYTYPASYTIITYIGCFLSVLGCLLVLLTLCLFQELLTLPNKILINVVVCILITSLLFIIGGPILGEFFNNGLCKAVAIFQHFFFVAMFTWIDIMMFEIARTFCKAHKIRSVGSKRHKCKLFTLYFVIGWIIPVVIVPSLIVDLSTDDRDKYDTQPTGQCWMNDKTWAIPIFLVVVALCIILSTIFFVMIVIYLCAAIPKRSSNTFKAHNQKAYYCWIIVAIFFVSSSVSGINWLVFGVLAILIDKSWAWYPFIICNSSLSVVIFLAFFGSKKVFKFYFNLVKRKTESSRKSESHTLNTKIHKIELGDITKFDKQQEV